MQIGDVLVGSEHPIALQTMTTTDTRDVEATVDQIKKCADAGADLVRVTVQGKKEAEACYKIRERLWQARARTCSLQGLQLCTWAAPCCACVYAAGVNPNRLPSRSGLSHLKPAVQAPYTKHPAHAPPCHGALGSTPCRSQRRAQHRGQVQDKYSTPMVADIHFQPTVAMMCADALEKVRINPGNFVDGRKSFEEIDYDDPAQFEDERQHIEEVFTPLVHKCKEQGTAMRIGTNHGSLSARILSYYGDTPAGAPLPVAIGALHVLQVRNNTGMFQPCRLQHTKGAHGVAVSLRVTPCASSHTPMTCTDSVARFAGMVASAFEFAEVCRKHDYHNFLFSMKASNPLVMAAAYRLLSEEQYARGWQYPLHLGVTGTLRCC